MKFSVTNVCPISCIELATSLDPDQTPLYDGWFGLSCSLLNRNLLYGKGHKLVSTDKCIFIQSNQYYPTLSYDSAKAKVPMKQRESYSYHGSNF